MTMRVAMARGILAGMVVLGMAGGSLASAAPPASAATVAATTSATISGTVTLTGKPAATASTACVSVFKFTGSLVSTDTAGATGKFQTSATLSTTSTYFVLAYTATATTPHGLSLSCTKSPYFQARYYQSAGTLSTAHTVKGGATGVDIALPPGGELSGTITSTGRSDLHPRVDLGTS